MIDSIQNTIHRLESFQKGAFGVLMDEVRKEEEFVLDLNRVEQLFKMGIDAGGEKLRPEYTAGTVRVKRSKGQPTDRVTLNDEDDFYKSFFTLFDGDKFYIFSEDPKAKYLFDKYGADVLGLTDDNILVLAVQVKDEFIGSFRKMIL